MSATQDTIFEDGKLCQSCPDLSRETQANGEVCIGCEAASCGHASLHEQEVLDLLDRARDSGFSAVSALLNQYDLWEAAVEVFMAAGGSKKVSDVRMKFVDEHLAPAIYRNGMPEKEKAA